MHASKRLFAAVLFAAAAQSAAANEPIYVSTQGDNANPGTQAQPVASITAAVALASGQPGRPVYIAGGDYAEPQITIGAGMELFGGFDPSTWDRTPAVTPTTIISTHRIAIVADAQGDTDASLTLDELSIASADANALSSLHTAAIELVNGWDIVIIANSILTGGASGSGENGALGADGASGSNGERGRAGCEDSGFGCASCSRPQGASGASAGSGAGAGGRGGDAGNGSDHGGTANTGGIGVGPGGSAFGGANAPGTPDGLGNICDYAASIGRNGADGSSGADGAGAEASLELDPINRGGAGLGGVGGGGGSGGGGGGGGTSGCDSYGGSGGGGGSGGSPGQGATGGFTGGNSYAVIVDTDFVGDLQLINVGLVTGGGGSGGDGGVGGVGGGGGTGGACSPYGGPDGQDDGTNGQRGGNGGLGGNGGAGGGGAGGSSVGVLNGGVNPIMLGTGITFELGSPGAAGAPNGQIGLSAQIVGASTGAIVQPDCNGNGVLDSIDIASAAAADINCNGVPDSCECPVDLTGEGDLNFFDVVAFIMAYNDALPIGDFNGDGMYNFFDVAAYLTAFQAGCP